MVSPLLLRIVVAVVVVSKQTPTLQRQTDWASSVCRQLFHVDDKNHRGKKQIEAKRIKKWGEKMLKMYRLLSTWLLPRLCPGLPHDNHRTIQIKDASTPERRRERVEDTHWPQLLQGARSLISLAY